MKKGALVGKLTFFLLRLEEENILYAETLIQPIRYLTFYLIR